MPTMLKRLKVRRIAVVDRGANQAATVELFKRDDTQEEVPVDGPEAVVVEETQPEMVSKADYEAAIAKAEAEKAELAKAAEAERAEAERVRAELAKRDEAIEIAKYDADAKAVTFLGPKGGAWLRAIAKALGEEDYGAFHGVLSGVRAQVDESTLLKEIGSGGDGDATTPQAVAKGLATRILAETPGLTVEQAMARAYDTPEYKAARKAAGGK